MMMVIDLNFNIDKIGMCRATEEETGTFEPEDGLILRGVSQSCLEEEVQGTNV